MWHTLHSIHSSKGLRRRLARRENAYGGGLLLRPPAECRKALGQRKGGWKGGGRGRLEGVGLRATCYIDSRWIRKRGRASKRLLCHSGGNNRQKMPFCLLAQAHRRSPTLPRSIRTNAFTNSADSFVNAKFALFINTDKATTIQTT